MEPVPSANKGERPTKAKVTTQLQAERIRGEMRAMLTGKAPTVDIMKALKISKSAYYRHLETLQKEDEDWMTKLALGNFISEFRITHDTQEALERMLMAIVASAKRDRDKIEAIRLCNEIEKDRLTLLAEGPTALAIRQRAKKKLDDQSHDVQKTS